MTHNFVLTYNFVIHSQLSSVLFVLAVSQETGIETSCYLSASDLGLRSRFTSFQSLVQLYRVSKICCCCLFVWLPFL